MARTLLASDGPEAFGGMGVEAHGRWTTQELVAGAGWALVVGVAVAWGAASVAGDSAQGLGAAPLVGSWHWHGSIRLAPALVLAASVVVAGDRVAGVLTRAGVALATGLTAIAWAVMLAASDGWRRLAAPLGTRFEYAPFAATIAEPAGFLRTFTERASSYPTHVKGHPPGATLTFWSLDRLGLHGVGWAAALVLVAWGIAAGAVIVATWHVAGAAAARTAAPFVALAPGAVWAGTSADALFAAVAATGVALLVVAHTQGRDRVGAAAAGGATLGAALQLSYGLALIVVVAGVVLAWRRAWAVMAWAALGAAVVTMVAAAAGFWWFDGLAVTRAAYWSGIAPARDGLYLGLVGNPAAFALATGPAWVVGLVALRGQRARVALLPVAALVAVVLADLSDMSRGEVERIWLPFVPWVLVATGGLAAGRARRCLAVQAATALALQACLVSPW